MSSADYLKQPYARRLVPDPSGGFVATIQEFPGCVAEGETADEALANLNAAAESWIDAVLALGQSVPPPIESHGYSGRIVLRMPRGLHKRVAETATAEATSINQLLVAAVSSYLGEQRAHNSPVRAWISHESLSKYFYPRLGEVRIPDQRSADRTEYVAVERFATASMDAPLGRIPFTGLPIVTTRR